ncbi:hypothetical protein EMCRGX_G023748 [Ephydatia muelleri]
MTPLHQAVIHECVKNTLSVLELANHVSVCRALINEAEGKVWELQHLCRLTIRKGLVTRSTELHENWERTRSTKAESVRKRIESHTPKSNRQCVDMLRAPAHSSYHTP